MNITFKKHRNTLKLGLLALFTLLFFNSSSIAADGEKLFKQNCASCHSAGTNKVVGPGLSGVEDRWKDKDVLYKWIKNSAEVLKSGDAYANSLFEQYNKMPMTSFANLSDDDITSILAYIKNPPKKAPDAAAAQSSDAKQGPVKADDDTKVILLGGLIILFLFIIGVLGSIRKSLSKLVAEKLQTPAEPEMGSLESIKYWCGNNKTWVYLIVLILFLYAGKVSWYAMKDIGVYEGYMPEQPIKYSHKLHAGQNAINCQYCHSAAYKGKVAGVPSANVCMNCHKYVQEGPVYGKTEIAKIYAALDYNPETQQYGPNQKPIKWVRIHNLPDHVYFNHSQHVVAGQVECQKCHGPIETMDTVKQFSPLTMGWCIECHRETEVKMEGNPYYTELHAKLKERFKGQKITVEKMGGLDCGKCHY